jgi:hypothetical protein
MRILKSIQGKNNSKKGPPSEPALLNLHIDIINDLPYRLPHYLISIKKTAIFGPMENPTKPLSNPNKGLTFALHKSEAVFITTSR